MLRLRNNGANPKRQPQCDLWCAAHQEHELAWQRVQLLHQELNANLRAVPGVQVALHALDNSSQRLGWRQALKLLSGALFLGSSAWVGKDLLGWQQWSADFATAVGEQRGFQLSDGTRLELNTDSATDLNFNAEQCLIKLRRGEILVACAADQLGTQHPLLVESRHALLEGFNARFVVRVDDRCTRLNMAQDSVVIHLPHVAEGRSARVGPRQSYRINHRLAEPAAPLAMDVGAWADGLIVTRNMRLDDFLQEVGRYRHGYLGCAVAIAHLRLSGVFRLEDTEKLLAILPQTLSVQLGYRTRWWVTLEPVV